MIKYQPILTPTRTYLAFAVAGFADLLQIPLHYFDGTFVAPFLEVPIRYVGLLIDALTAAVTIILIGFHPALLPGFIAKIVPGVAGLPAWTACVAYAVWQRKHETPKPPEGAQPKAETIRPGPEAFVTPAASRSFNWLLVSGSLLVAAILWFNPPFHRRSAPPKYAFNPAPPDAPAAALPPPNPSGTPRVVVAPIENQSKFDASMGFEQTRHIFPTAPSGPFAPENIRSMLEDIVGNIDGVNLLERQQAQLYAGQYEAGASDMSEKDKLAQLRAIMAPNIVVFAAILDIHEDKTDIKAYGTDLQSLHSQCSIRVQVMDASSGSITFSKTLTGSTTETKGANVAITSTEDRDYEVVKSALDQLTGDDSFKRSVLGPKNTPELSRP